MGSITGDSRVVPLPTPHTVNLIVTVPPPCETAQAPHRRPRRGHRDRRRSVGSGSPVGGHSPSGSSKREMLGFATLKICVFF